VGARFLIGAAGIDQGAVRGFLGDEFAGSTPDADAELTVWGEAEGDRLAQSIQFAGDLDQDGFDDFVAGTDHDQYADSDSGAAYVFYGPLTGDIDAAAAPIRHRGLLGGDLAGYDIAAGSDLDGDGIGDIVVGAYLADEGAGEIYVFYGGAL
jgi:hypothetical protein